MGTIDTHGYFTMFNINEKFSGDSHYRYKMPALEVREDGRSKQRKTWLNNLTDVAESLRRNPELLVQWYAAGTSGGADLSAGYPRWYLKGQFSAAELQQKTRDFCAKLVVCPRCGDCGTRLYSTVHGSKKKPQRIIHLVCGACGFDGASKEQDAKLARHVPERAAAAVDGTGLIAKQHQHKDRKDAPDSVKPTKARKTKKKPAVEEESDDDEEWFTDTSAEAIAARRREALEANKFAQEVTATDKSVEKGVPATNLSAAAVAVTVEAVEEEEVAPATPAAAAAEQVDKAADSVDAFDAVSEKLLSSFITHIGETKKIKQKKVLAAAEAWINAELTVVQEAQKSTLFTMLEHLPQNVMTYSNAVLKVMYDHDAVTEEDISVWHGAAADTENAALINAKEFIDFLKQQ